MNQIPQGVGGLSHVRFACEHCGQRLKVGSQRAGNRVQCPKCRTQMVVPDLASASPAKDSPAKDSPAKDSPAKDSPASKQPVKPPRAKAAPRSDAAGERGGAPPARLAGQAESVDSQPAARALVSGESPESLESLESGGSSAPATDWAANSPEIPTLESIAQKLITGESGISGESGSPGPVDTESRSSGAALPQFALGAAPLWDAAPAIDVYEETEWVYEDQAPPPPLDPEKLAVSRRVVYGQGVLLLVTAIAAFALGVLSGRGTVSAPQAHLPDNPCQLSGKVEFAAGRLGLQADLGSIVIAVPRGRRFDPAVRRQLENILVVSNENDPLVHLLRELDGDLAVVDRLGQFQLEVPSPGDYNVLVLSAGAQRPAGEPLDKQHLAEIGNYFGPAARLLGDRQYQWRNETIRKDQRLQILFQ